MRTAPETRSTAKVGLDRPFASVALVASSEARRAVDRPPPQPTGPNALVSRECGYAQTSAAGPIRGPALMPREVCWP